MEFTIEYLLEVQKLRELTEAMGIPIMTMVSVIAVVILPMAELIFFWCVDKGWGYRMVWAMTLSELINQVLKLTACVYRPWILDDRIHPIINVLTSPGGYSFPSGHTQTAAAIYGVLALWLFRRGYRKSGCVSLAMIFLTAFSRNYLGLHTLWDVLAAILETALVVFVVCTAADRMEQGRLRLSYLPVLAAGILLAAGVVIYLAFKSYPMDLDASGNLLVDPRDMVHGGYEAVGGFLGILMGTGIERRFLLLRTEGLTKGQRWKRGTLGITVTLILLALGKGVLPQILGIPAGSLIGRFLPYITASAILPLGFQKIK